MPSPFSRLLAAPTDPNFLAAAEAKAAGAEAIDATLGVIKDDTGATVMFDCVRAAAPAPSRSTCGCSRSSIRRRPWCSRRPRG